MGGQKEEKLLLSLVEFGDHTWCSQKFCAPQVPRQCRCSELHWLYWFACKAEMLGQLLGNLGGCSQGAGSCCGDP